MRVIPRFFIVIWVVSVAYGGRSPALGADARLTVAADGKSPYTIVVSDGAHAGRIGQASALLREVIDEVAGVKLPVVKESRFRGGAPAIYLGKTRAASRAGLPVDTVKGFACLNRVVGRDIFLVGADGSAADRDGLLAKYPGVTKAVTTFLEDQAGVRFLLPGKFGRHVPKLEALRVDADMDVTASPAFDYVTGRSAREPAYNAANNYFGNQVVHSYGGHSYYSAVPEKKFGKSNPDYFALIGGIRTPKGNHLCISNSRVQELMLLEMERQLDKGYRWVELAQTDGYQECDCAECRAIHPDRGERLWIVHRKLAEEMKKRRPDKKVMIISYGPTSAPPQSFESFPDNVVIQLCNYSEASFRAWAPFNVAKTVYIYNWLAPARIAPRYAVDQIRRFAANGVRGIYICGGLSNFGAWGLDGPSYYAFGKAIGDPSREARDLTEQYIRAAFGEAASPMRAFYRAMHKRSEVYALIDRQRGYSFAPDAGDFVCHFFSPKALGDMIAGLERALSIAEDEKVKARLALVEAEFKLLRARAVVYHMYRAYRLAPSWETLGLLEKSVRDYKETTAWLMPGGKVRTIAGLRPPYSGRPPLAGGAPFSWDFALLREKRVLPGVGMKRAEVRGAGDFRLDGRLDEAWWADAPFHELSEIGMGRLETPSRFKVAYDAEHFYVGFEAELPSADALDSIKAVGRDGQGWKQENLEIVVDPFGERRRYCHFMLNPAPDSIFDRRFGYEDDPLHPLYGKFDRDWNGEWDYATVIDRENRHWTAEVRIPFRTLGAEPPKPGAMWTLNVGRTQFFPGEEHPRYSLWSPNLEARSFHDISTFGEITFK